MGLISNGTTLLDAGATSSGVFSGAMVLLSTTTASSSATIDITSGINSTYKEYQIHFFDVHPQSGSRLGFPKLLSNLKPPPNESIAIGSE